MGVISLYFSTFNLIFISSFWIIIEYFKLKIETYRFDIWEFFVLRIYVSPSQNIIKNI